MFPNVRRLPMKSGCKVAEEIKCQGEKKFGEKWYRITMRLVCFDGDAGSGGSEGQTWKHEGLLRSSYLWTAKEVGWVMVGFC